MMHGDQGFRGNPVKSIQVLVHIEVAVENTLFGTYTFIPSKRAKIEVCSTVLNARLKLPSVDTGGCCCKLIEKNVPWK